MFLSRPLFRIVPDNTNIPFMRGRVLGVAFSALLSVLSLVLAFYPGLEKGIDFRGGIIMEVRTPAPANLAAIRAGVSALDLGDVGVQEFGDASTVLLRLPVQGDEGATQSAVNRVRGALEEAAPGARLLRTEAVGNRVSAELFQGSLIALGISMLAMMAYIWFRFEWQFAVGAIVTLLLETTKVVGFLAVTRIEFSLTTVAAVLTIIGFSVNDKVVVYDRMRENLRKYKTMPLQQLIDKSINETLNRTIGTSMTLLLSALPLALFGGDALSGFAWTMVFGIVASTSSSIFIAAPILLFLGENRLRRGTEAVAAVPSKGQ
ncbi:protein translocase subunit SecF [Pseudoroseomonas cervicalis]|uniref:protein translocase subunit SecF n=1 Tax=Teichococcus cervicalis TaxID=204525 RepID=UPI0022F1C07E|nr:protein translocase subunit SecF [Pseudoroseomonas cervicalis]MDQ1078773.1 preprotein translocase SecF subunit [Pseudoroseomonas cervicalis]WBV41962.1 protein translocase subunit SecF [Pseudoroseomonas cervicalis]